MQLDWRVGALIIVLVVGVILVAALAGPRGDDRAADSGGPPACPPGHVTSSGCSKP